MSIKNPQENNSNKQSSSDRLKKIFVAASLAGLANISNVRVTFAQENTPTNDIVRTEQVNIPINKKAIVNRRVNGVVEFVDRINGAKPENKSHDFANIKIQNDVFDVQPTNDKISSWKISAKDVCQGIVINNPILKQKHQTNASTRAESGAVSQDQKSINCKITTGSYDPRYDKNIPNQAPLDQVKESNVQPVETKSVITEIQNEVFKPDGKYRFMNNGGTLKALNNTDGDINIQNPQELFSKAAQINNGLNNPVNKQEVQTKMNIYNNKIKQGESHIEATISSTVEYINDKTNISAEVKTGLREFQARANKERMDSVSQNPNQPTNKPEINTPNPQPSAPELKLDNPITIQATPNPEFKAPKPPEPQPTMPIYNAKGTVRIVQTKPEMAIQPITTPDYSKEITTGISIAILLGALGYTANRLYQKSKTNNPKESNKDTKNADIFDENNSPSTLIQKEPKSTKKWTDSKIYQDLGQIVGQSYYGSVANTIKAIDGCKSWINNLLKSTPKPTTEQNTPSQNPTSQENTTDIPDSNTAAENANPTTPELTNSVSMDSKAKPQTPNNPQPESQKPETNNPDDNSVPKPESPKPTPSKTESNDSKYAVVDPWNNKEPSQSDNSQMEKWEFTDFNKIIPNIESAVANQTPDNVNAIDKNIDLDQVKNYYGPNIRCELNRTPTENDLSEITKDINITLASITPITNDIDKTINQLKNIEYNIALHKPELIYSLALELLKQKFEIENFFELDQYITEGVSTSNYGFTEDFVKQFPELNINAERKHMIRLLKSKNMANDITSADGDLSQNYYVRLLFPDDRSRAVSEDFYVYPMVLKLLDVLYKNKELSVDEILLMKDTYKKMQKFNQEFTKSRFKDDSYFHSQSKKTPFGPLQYSSDRHTRLSATEYYTTAIESNDRKVKIDPQLIEDITNIVSTVCSTKEGYVTNTITLPLKKMIENKTFMTNNPISKEIYISMIDKLFEINKHDYNKDNTHEDFVNWAETQTEDVEMRKILIKTIEQMYLKYDNGKEVVYNTERREPETYTLLQNMISTDMDSELSIRDSLSKIEQYADKNYHYELNTYSQNAIKEIYTVLYKGLIDQYTLVKVKNIQKTIEIAE